MNNPYPPAPPKPKFQLGKRYQPKDFYQGLYPYAAAESARSGIPAEVYVAIAANETGWGEFSVGNNLYGIKGSNPRTGANTGPVPTWEVYDGKRVEINDTFRAYDSIAESMSDFTSFINNNERYSRAVEEEIKTGNIRENPFHFLKKIRDAGYATDPDWAWKINNIMGMFNQQWRAEVGTVDQEPLPILAEQSDSPYPMDPETRHDLERGMDRLTDYFAGYKPMVVDQRIATQQAADAMQEAARKAAEAKAKYDEALTKNAVARGEGLWMPTFSGLLTLPWTQQDTDAAKKELDQANAELDPLMAEYIRQSAVEQALILMPMAINSGRAKTADELLKILYERTPGLELQPADVEKIQYAFTQMSYLDRTPKNVTTTELVNYLQKPPTAMPITLSNMTASTISKVLSNRMRSPLPDGITEEQARWLLGRQQLDPDEMLSTQKAFDDAVVAWHNSYVDLQLKREALKDGKILELTPDKYMMTAIMQPAMLALEGLEWYANTITKPLAAEATIQLENFLNKLAQGPEARDNQGTLGRIREDYIRTGKPSWEANLLAWDDPRAIDPFHVELGPLWVGSKGITEVLIDPLNVIGMGIIPKTVGRLPYIGRVFNALEYGWNHFWGDPVDQLFIGGKKLWGQLPKTHIQMSLDIGRETYSVIQSALVRDFNQATRNAVPNLVGIDNQFVRKMIPIYLSEAYKVGREGANTFWATQRAKAGATLLRSVHQYITPDEITRKLLRPMGVKDGEVTRQALHDINLLFDSTTYGPQNIFHTPLTAAQQIVNILAEANPGIKDPKKAEEVFTVAKDFWNNRWSGYNKAVLKIFDNPSATKALDLTIKASIDNYLNNVRSPVFQYAFQTGIMQGMVRSIDTISQVKYARMLDRLQSGFARHYLLFFNYGPMNVVESAFRSWLGGVNPFYGIGADPTKYYAAVAGDLSTADKEIINASAMGELLAKGDEAQLLTKVKRQGHIPGLTRDLPSKIGPLQLPKYLRSMQSWNDWFGEIGVKQRAWYLTNQYVRELETQYPTQIRMIKQAVGEIPRIEGFSSRQLREIQREVYFRSLGNPGYIKSMQQSHKVYERKKFLTDVQEVLDQHPEIDLAIRDQILDQMHKPWAMQRDRDGNFIGIDRVFNNAWDVYQDNFVAKLGYASFMIDNFVKDIQAHQFSSPREMANLLTNLQVILRAIPDHISKARQIATEKGAAIKSRDFKQELHDTSWEVVDGFIESYASQLRGLYDALMLSIDMIPDNQHADVMRTYLHTIFAEQKIIAEAWESDATLAREMFSTPRANRDEAFWQKYYAARKSNWDEVTTKRGAIEAQRMKVWPYLVGIINPDYDPASFAQRMRGLPDFKNARLTIDSVAKLLEVPVDEVGRFTLTDALTVMSKDNFIDYIRSHADINGEADSLGWTRAKIGQVYDDIIKSVGMSPERVEMLAPVKASMDSMKEGIIRAYVNRAIPEKTIDELNSWLGGVYDRLSQLPMFRSDALPGNSLSGGPSRLDWQGVTWQDSELLLNMVENIVPRVAVGEGAVLIADFTGQTSMEFLTQVSQAQSTHIFANVLESIHDAAETTARDVATIQGNQYVESFYTALDMNPSYYGINLSRKTPNNYLWNQVHYNPWLHFANALFREFGSDYHNQLLAAGWKLSDQQVLNISTDFADRLIGTSLHEVAHNSFRDHADDFKSYLKAIKTKFYAGDYDKVYENTVEEISSILTDSHALSELSAITRRSEALPRDIIHSPKFLKEVSNASRSGSKVSLFGKEYDPSGYAPGQPASSTGIPGSDARGGLRPGEGPGGSQARAASGWYYSGLARAVTTLKQEKFQASQLMGMLKGLPVKADEIKWTGLDEWLKEKGNAKITKQQVLDYLAENEVRVEEKVLGEAPEWQALDLQFEQSQIDPNRWTSNYNYDIIKREIAPGQHKFFVVDRGVDDAYDAWHVSDTLEGAQDAIRSVLEDQAPLDNAAVATQYSSYIQPFQPSTGYRELLLTLPRKSSTAEQQIKAYQDTLINRYGHEPTREELNPQEAMELSRLENLRYGDKADQYNAPHFSGNPNILAHVRFDDRVDDAGNKVLFIHEFQSDWHQTGAKSGYVNNEEKKALQRKVDDLNIRIDEITKQIEDLHVRPKEHILVPEQRPDGSWELREYTYWGERLNTRRGYLYETKENALAWAKQENERLAHVGGQQYSDTPPVPNADVKALIEKRYKLWQERWDAERELSRAKEGVPDAPFKSMKWVDLSMKRMIRYAAENGYDKIAWTTGVHQSERYGALLRYIDRITYSESSHELTAYGRFGSRDIPNVTWNNMSDYIGAENVSKLKAGVDDFGNYVLEGTDLTVRTSMTGKDKVYDERMVQAANELGKKFGSKVGEIKIANGPDLGNEALPQGWTIRKQGDWKEPYTGYWELFDNNGKRVTGFLMNPSNPMDDSFNGALGAYNQFLKDLRNPGRPNSYDRFEAEYPFLMEAQTKYEQVHSLTITDSMRDSAVYEGFPLFLANRGGGAIPQPPNPEALNWLTSRESAMQAARDKYSVNFTDYTNQNAVDAVMRALFPFWTYESQRWPWMLKTVLQKPGVALGWNRYMQSTDEGYIPIPGSDIQFNPLRGTAFMGGFRRLMQRDFPAYYDATPAADFIEWMGKYGFFPGPHVMIPLIGLGGADPYGTRREWGEILPQWVQTPLDLYIMTNPNSPGAKGLIETIFPQRFKDYSVIQMVNKYGGDGQSIWMKKRQGLELTPEEAQQWDTALQKVHGMNLFLQQFGVFRFRPEERRLAEQHLAQLYQEMTGVSPAEQKRIRNLSAQTGQRFEDMFQLGVDQKLLLQQTEAYQRWGKMSTPLLPTITQREVTRINQYWEEVDRIRARARTEGWRDDSGKLVQMSINQLDTEFMSGNISAEDYRKQVAEAQSRAVKEQEALKNSHYFKGVPITLEERMEFYNKHKVMQPVFHPSDELFQMYYDIKPELSYDEDTNTWGYDFDKYFAKVQLLMESLPDFAKQDFLSKIHNEWTPLQNLYYSDSTQYFASYRNLRNLVLAQYTPEEQSLINQYYRADRPVQDAIRKEVMAGNPEQKLLADFEKKLRTARENLRIADPVLDAKLSFWKGMKPLTPAAEQELKRLNKQYRPGAVKLQN
jgi:hypothetical protein